LLVRINEERKRPLSCDPSLYRNESEVESKLIVSYLLPKLGYSPDSWYQEVAFGSIRLDFLAFATQVLPFGVSPNFPLSIVMEAKSPKQNLDKHVLKFRHYLTSLNVLYGLLTNGKEIRIYKRVLKDIQLIFTCQGHEVEEKFQEIKAILGKDSLKDRNQIKVIEPATPDDLKESNMKVIAIYHNKGGVGKTTTVVNLAAALSKKGQRILVIDLDSQANTTFAVGLAKFVDEKDDDIKNSYIYHVIKEKNKYPIHEVTRKSTFNDPEIDVIPCHIDLMLREFELKEISAANTRLRNKLEQVKDQYDIVIIDTPPSLNLYAKIAMITADYLIIPSDLKPFANEGLVNVKNFVQDTDEVKTQLGLSPIEILGVLPSKISTNNKFINHTLPNRESVILERYNIPVMKSRIFEREDLAKSVEKMVACGELDIPDPRSIFDFKPDSLSSQEFEALALEVIEKIGVTV
jgi:chromosome partitioning protein